MLYVVAGASILLAYLTASRPSPVSRLIRFLRWAARRPAPDFSPGSNFYEDLHRWRERRPR